MTRLVKMINDEYVQDEEGCRPRRRAGMRNLTRIAVANFDMKKNTKKKFLKFAFNEKTQEESYYYYADLISVSNAAWKPFRSFFSRLTKRSKLPSANQPATKSSILKISVEILSVILRYLGPIDCTILQYTCKSLYRTIRADDCPCFEQDKLAKLHVAARLLDSNICPRIKASTGTRHLTRDELVATMQAGFSCKLCQEIWPGEGRNAVRCPFHAHVPGRKHCSTLSSSTWRVVNPFSWRRPYWERHPQLDEYVWIVKREAALDAPDQWDEFGASYISSWRDALVQMEVELYTHQHYDSLPIVDPSIVCHGVLPDYSSSISLTPTRPQTPASEIVTLTCCSHCMEVILAPIEGNSSNWQSCISCGCTQCGWTDLRFFRVPESTQSGFRVRHIPLGDVGGNRGKRKWNRTGLSSEGGSGKMLYGTVRFGSRGPAGACRVQV